MPPTARKPAKQFPLPVKNVTNFDVPDLIIAHLTSECGGNVHDRHVVNVTGGSFEEETQAVSNVAKNAADLENDSCFDSAFRKKDIRHTRNNWICYNFKKRRIVPTHYTVRTYYGGPGCEHLKSGLVEASADRANGREVARQEDSKQLDGRSFAATFVIAGGPVCRLLRLVQIGMNHYENDQFVISAWEIFGSFIENAPKGH